MQYADNPFIMCGYNVVLIGMVKAMIKGRYESKNLGRTRLRSFPPKT
jgi:hypothetical protein